MSATIASRESPARSTSSAGAPAMPSEVVLTRRSACGSSAGISRHAAGAIRPGAKAASSCPLPSVRFATTIFSTPRSSRPATTPRAKRVLQVGEEAGDVGVVAVHAAVLDPQRVHGRKPPRPLGRRVREAKGGLFVRDGDVAASKAVLGKAAEERVEILRLDVDAFIRARKPMLLQPVAVDQRRARMRDRMPGDEGLRDAHGFT